MIYDYYKLKYFSIGVENNIFVSLDYGSYLKLILYFALFYCNFNYIYGLIKIIIIL